MALRNTLFNCARSSKAKQSFRNFAKDTDNKFALGVVDAPAKDFNSINLTIGSWENVEIVEDDQNHPQINNVIDNILYFAVYRTS